MTKLIFISLDEFSVYCPFKDCDKRVDHALHLIKYFKDFIAKLIFLGSNICQ